MTAITPLTLFIINLVLVLVDAALGFHLAPRLLSSIDDPEMKEQAVRATRRTLSAVVALYMFFNCVGYFRGKSSWLGAVLLLVLLDMGLQLWLTRHRAEPPGGNDPDTPS